MADQNESNNRRGMNTFADDIDRSSTLSELERIGARASRKGIQRTQLEERIRTEGRLLNSLMDQGRQTPSFMNSPFYQEQTQGLRDSIRGIRGQMNTLDTTARTRAESEASTYISRQFTPASISGQVSGMQRDSAIQNRAFSMSGQSYDQLESRRQEILADVRVRERTAQNEVKGLFSGRGQVDPEKSAALGVMMSGTQSHFKELATINAAHAFQRASGTDPNSKIKNLANAGNDANQMLSAEAIAKEVRSGGIQISQGGKMGTVANEDVGKEVVNQARLLSQALKELSDGVGKTDEELAKLRQTADESAENFNKLKDAQRAGAGGGSFNGANLAMGLAGGFNAIGVAAQQILVNQSMQDTANTSGFANLANEQYDTYKKARGGDIASQLAISQYGDAGQFGDEMKAGTLTAQSAFFAAGGAQATAGTIMATNAVKNATVSFGLTGSQEFMAGAQNVVQGGSTMAVAGSDMARGTSSNAAKLAAIQANMQARKAINAVGAEQSQGLRNFYTDLDSASQELGGGAGMFLDMASSQPNLAKMSSARMSPEQFSKLAQQAGAGMGSTFDVDQIYTARQMERNGFGSAGTNIQRMSTLSAAGGNNPAASMQGVLEAAFTKGLDSSKAINMMVENTKEMAVNTAAAAAGIDVTGAAGTMLAAGVNPNMANKEAALQQAIQASQVTAGITTNKSASFSGMVNTAAIQKATGISGVEAIIAQGITIQEYKTLQKDPKKASEFYKDQGINISEARAESFTKEMLKQKQDQIIRDKGMALNLDPKIAERVKAGTASETEQIQFNQAMTFSGYKGGAQGLREIQGVTAENSVAGVNQAKGAGSEGDLKDLKKQFDDLRTGGFAQLADAAGVAATNLDKFGGALKVFNDLQQGVEKNGPANEAAFTDAAAKMAKDFSASVGLFDTATDKYSQASDKLMAAAGLLSNGKILIPNQYLNDAQSRLDQLTGSKKGN